MDRVLSPHDYQDMISRVEKDLVFIRDNLTDLQKQTSPFRNYIQNEAPMVENLQEYYRKSDGVLLRHECGSGSVEKSGESVALTLFLVPQTDESCNQNSLKLFHELILSYIK